jgi:mono/diheme cytochrome c family protein
MDLPLTTLHRAGFLTTALVLFLGASAVITSPLRAAAQDEEKPVTFTSEQASRGAALYRKNCLDCHGENLDDGEFGGAPLRGNAFREKWFENSVGALVGFMHSTMPPDRPGTLSDQNYVDLAAYILSRNGIQATPTEMPMDPDALENMIVR